VRADEAAARARALDLGDHGGLSLRDAAAKRRLEPARRIGIRGAAFHLRDRHRCARRLDLAALGRDDPPHHVRHQPAFAKERVKCTSCSSFARAAPLAIASRAAATPSHRLPTTPETYRAAAALRIT